MKSSLFIPALMLLLSVASCAPSPKPIDYGNDMCHYCKMAIVGQQHAAEAVTDKGKVYKFDAIECMVNYLHEQEGRKHAYLLVNDFHKPGELISAAQCLFLISEAVPSPMGANLSAFASEEQAWAMQQEKGGTLYSWTELLRQLK